MANKYRGGRLKAAGRSGRLEESASHAFDAYRSGMDEFALNVGAAAVFTLIDSANAYIAEQEPWTLARDPANADRLTQVLFDVAEAVRIAGILLLPIMPKSAAEILRRVGETRPVESLRLDAARWKHGGRAHHRKRNRLMASRRGH